jgi:hypothetical protein
MERFSPLMLAIAAVILGTLSADHVLTKRAIPELKPPAAKGKLTMRAIMVPASVPEPLIPPPPPPMPADPLGAFP